jgi:ABC-type enterochelin transport system substrate-binding protein
MCADTRFIVRQHPGMIISISRYGQKNKKTAASKKNKQGVKNSLVNNVNARKKKGISRPKCKSTVTKKTYREMQSDWQ